MRNCVGRDCVISPRRIEIAGSVCQATSRGDRRQPIYHDDQCKATQLEIMTHAMHHFYAQVSAHRLLEDDFYVVPHIGRAKRLRVILTRN